MHSTEHPIEKVQTSSGLNVLLIPSKIAPVVSLQGWIRFGSADETDDIAGIAHLFEHLLFKGTKKRAVGRIAQEIEGLGGDLNAYTSFDQTVMHMTLPKLATNQGLDILADALQNSVVDEDELAREKPVILEEIKRRNDNPGSIPSDLLNQSLFKGHTYARPIIGYSHVVEAIPREKILEIYHRYYNARNLFLVVAGDFERDQVLSQIEKLFSGLKTGPAPGARTKIGPLLNKELLFQNHPTYPDSLIRMAWRAPRLDDPAVPALDALSLVLGGGESSRFSRVLVHEKSLVRDIGCGSWNPKDDGYFTIVLKGAKGFVNKLGTVTNEIRNLVEQRVTESELERAKNNLLASALYSKETVDGLASRFGYFEALANDYRLDNTYLQAIDRLTIGDLEEAKERFINFNTFVAAGIVPKGDRLPAEKDFFKSPTALKSKSFKIKKDTYGVEHFDFRGLPVQVRTVKELPIFSMRWVGLGGTRIETEATAGTGSMWAKTVTLGALSKRKGRALTKQEIFEFTEGRSASLSAFFGRNSQGLQVDGLSRDFEDLFDLAAASWLDPTFDDRSIALEKTHTLTDIKSQKDSPSWHVFQMLNAALYPKHAYGRPGFGSEKNIARVTSKSLHALHKKLQSQAQSLCIVGDTTPLQVQALLERNFDRSFKGPQKSIKKLSVGPVKGQTLRHTMKKEQTHIALGYRTTDFFSKDRTALMGLGALLSGQGGRLFVELRDKMSLCYTVSPTHQEGLDAGHFAFYIATSPEKTELAINALDQQIDRLVAGDVSEQEWAQARQFFVGNHIIENQRLGSQATSLALDALYGLDSSEYFGFEEKLKAVSAADIARVAKKYFSPKAKKSRVAVIVGPKVSSKSK